MCNWDGRGQDYQISKLCVGVKNKTSSQYFSSHHAFHMYSMGTTPVYIYIYTSFEMSRIYVICIKMGLHVFYVLFTRAQF